MNFKTCKHLRKRTKKFFPRDVDLGLGDYVEKALSAFGVTKTRWAKLTGQYQKETPGCRKCDKREDFTNWAGSKLGLPPGKSTEFRHAVEGLTLKEERIFGCDVKGECIGRGSYEPKIVEAIEATGISLCQHCNQYEQKEV